MRSAELTFDGLTLDSPAQICDAHSAADDGTGNGETGGLNFALTRSVQKVLSATEKILDHVFEACMGSAGVAVKEDNTKALAGVFQQRQI